MKHTSLARKRLLVALTFAFLLLASATTILSSDLITEGVSAAPAPGRSAAWWDGGGADNKASTVENWENDTAPSTGNDIVIHYGNKAITWDISASFGDFLIRSTYTGTITMGASYEVMEFYQASGSTLTASASYILTVNGNYSNYGTLTANLLGLNMTGDDRSVYMTGNPSKVWIYGNTTWSTSNNIRNSLYIASNKTITLVTALTLQTQMSGYSYTNLGSIITQGASYFKFQAGTSGSRTITFGNIGACILETSSASTTSNVITLGTETTFFGNINIASSHASNTMTLDLGGEYLFCNKVTVGTRGLVVSSLPSSSMGLTTGASSDCMIINANGVVNATNISSITLNGNWDSSAGSWFPSSSLVSFTGTGKTIKTATGQTFYNLDSQESSSTTQLSNIEVTNWMNPNGTWTKGAFTLTAPLMTISSSITATGTEDAAYSYTPTADQPISSVSVVTNATWLSIIGTSVVGTPSNTEVGTFYVNVTCTNIIGSVSQNSTITISNTAPVWLTADYSTEWSYGMTYSYDPSASDEGAGLTYSMTTSAIELRCDPTSGAIRGKVMDNSITVSLMADDGHGGVIWQNWTITAMGFSWDGDVLVNYTEGQNLKVTFNASLTNATYNAIIKSVQWNFGDGNGSRVLDLMPMHPYERAGTYMVTCYIVTEDDMTATKNFQITVGDPALVEQLENEYAERVNQAVLISGLACAFGLVLIACYIKVAGRRGWINRLVPIMIVVAMLAISATLIGSAMQ